MVNLPALSFKKIGLEINKLKFNLLFSLTPADNRK